MGVQFKLQMLAKTMVVNPLKIGYNTYKYGYIYIYPPSYPLVWKPWPIELHDKDYYLPIRNGDFPGRYANQMVAKLVFN